MNNLNYGVATKGVSLDHSRRQFLAGGTAALLSGVVFSRSVWADESVELQSSDNSLVGSVRFLGNQFLDNQVGVTGADGATSTVLPSGDSLWMFGDTVEGPFKSIRGLELTRLRSNTGALVPKQDASQGIKHFKFLADETGKRPRQLVPFAADEDPAVNRVWAIHGVVVDSKVFLFYHRISLLKNVDVFVNFQLDGMGIAKADVGDLAFDAFVGSGWVAVVLEDAGADVWRVGHAARTTISMCGAA